MDLQQFDSTLKSALENLEVPYDASTWASLESRLDRLPAPDAVDKAMRGTLERMEMSYDATSWTMLADRMDGITRVRKLRMTKAAEAAILLLLLLNLKGFFGVVESVTNPAPAKQDAPGPIAHARSGKSHKQKTGAAAAESASLTEQVVAFVQDVTASLTNPTPAPIPNEETANTAQPIAANTSLLDPARFYTQPGLVKFATDALPVKSPKEPVLIAGLMPAIPGLELPKPVKNSHLYAATFASYDKNYFHDGSFKDKKNGYGGGFAVGYRKGKWGVETGIAYSEKNYAPKRVNETYENNPFTGISIYYTENVDADVVSVPLKVTRRIAKAGKTTAHAVAGLSAQFATSKAYAYKTVHYPPPVPQPNPDPNPPSIAAFPEGKGILENGGLARNVYATADLGLRVEQPIGKRYVAFVEPVYRQSLGGGFGPATGRINTFAIQAGVMASL